MLRFTFKNSFNEKVSLKASASAYAVSCEIGLLLKPGPRLWTPTQENLDPEKPGPWKTCTSRKMWKIAGCGKKIERPHSIIY